MTIIKTINGVHRTKTNKEINKPTCIQNAHKMNTNKETNNTTTTIRPHKLYSNKSKSIKQSNYNKTNYIQKKHTHIHAKNKNNKYKAKTNVKLTSRSQQRHIEIIQPRTEEHCLACSKINRNQIIRPKSFCRYPTKSGATVSGTLT